jgi:hypothetical protein
MLISYEDTVAKFFSKFKFTEAELTSCERIHEVLQKKRRIHSKYILEQNVNVNDFLLFLWSKGFIFRGATRLGLRKLSPYKQPDRNMEKLLFFTSSPIGAWQYAYDKRSDKYWKWHSRGDSSNYCKYIPIYVIKDNVTVLKDIKSQDYFFILDDNAQFMAQNELLTRQPHKVEYEIIVDERRDFINGKYDEPARIDPSLIFPREIN